ncbi:cob(I)yrinic acid a,c-diamide adenosyltransferase [Persephonella hydrogeniphila]|uniref:corrinoid adenosyltransferase n=1 Tax=Persephonella hydrogeniphila TaxID=198703 RepID=A0A285N3X4_9AQUI|nr:cob(I)yrinic acid a,c-diamide adenosyltransferase [Persephonella hydrogeniphila]SNZ04018.1 cob(I)yrinic acid a,c-diamide adenosyltransferase [Persephonella hydrogeniphila]
MIYVFTGDGKGKTTAAVGTGIRAVGAGLKVLMVQFMKVKELSSEYYVLSKLKNFDIESFGRKGFYLPEEEIKKNPELAKKGFKPFTAVDYQLAQDGIDKLKNSILNEEHDLYILDEICVALHYRLVEENELKKILLENREKADFILTGRYCPGWVLEVADLVTEMKEIKHPFKKGIPAKKGLDY